MTKNVLILIPSIYVGGGAEKIATVIGNQLINKGFDVHYFTFFKYDSEYLTKGTHYSLKYVYNRSFIYRLRLLPKIYRELVDYVARNNIDVVISHMEYSALLTIWLKKRIRSLKAITVVHGNVYKRFFGNIITRHYGVLDRVVCVSKGIEKDLINTFGLKNTTTIYNPFTVEHNLVLSKENVEEQDEKYFDGNNYVFINIGRLTRQKGQWFLIRAFKEVNTRYPNTRLLILGEGELRNPLVELVKKSGLDKNIHLIGIRKNIFPYLRRSNCLAFSSLWEGLPTVLIESLHIDKLNIISTDCRTGPREILDSSIDIDEEIRYPKETAYGTLISPFPNYFLFKTLDDKPLIKEEKEMADVMMDKLNRNTEQKDNVQRANSFDEDNIIAEWIGIISS
jgi:glycosyltransferase involved in cell wall biosynthesis